ncbi:MAG: acyltransferase [Prevotella sp.]|nr:acyltransferase [Prevotella sp.]
MILLSKAQCSALRGMAIVGIFMHNYLHWLGPMVKENEYTFTQDNADRMLAEFINFQPSTFILQLFSFFGHYGVPVFLFLSGYGLVKKYETPSEPTLEGMACRQGRRTFLWKHYMKLFPMMLLGFVVFAMVDWMTPGRHHWAWTDIIAQLTMIINLLPDPDHIIWPGPYWFFGLMMQLYLIYILVLHRRHWGWTAGLMVVCTVLQAMCFDDPEGDTLNRLRYNCIGGMLPFGMGLLLARWEGKIKPCTNAAHLVVLLLSILLIFSLSLNFWCWLFVPVFIITSHVAFVRILPESAMRPLVWLGALSAAIFVAHPVTRKIFIPISRHGDILDGLVMYIVATILLSMIYRLVIKKLQEK